MRFLHLAFITTSLALAACSSAIVPTEPVVYSQSEAADSVKVRVGQTIVVGGIRLRFEAVESDSRCPMDAVCIWAGDAVANLTVEQNCDCRSPAFTLRLHTFLEPKSAVVYGNRIELRALLPYPSSQSTIKPDAYSAWLRIVRVD